MKYMIDLIIPTMWRSKNFLDCLEKYVKNANIKNIIIIDNDYVKRPKINFSNEKIKIFKFTNNVFVNPAWNFGVSKAESDIICILNDDICISNDIFDLISKTDFEKEKIDLIGSLLVDRKTPLKLSSTNINKKIFIGDQYTGFGTCMFLKREKYVEIPSLYKIWFGDDFLVKNAKNILTVPLNIKMCSETINSSYDTEREILKKRIILDAKNAKKYLNCISTEGKDWIHYK